MTTFLADGNVLVALAVRDHVHHAAATSWFAATSPELATCPLTQGTLMRYLIRTGVGPAEAIAVLNSILEQPWHKFWADLLPFDANMFTGVIGHRQVNDAYLAALAEAHGAQIATFDAGLAALRPGQVTLLTAT